MMTYSEMEREINEIPKFGAKASLSNLSDYLELANHPERNLRVIHIAGTNGKGSVSAYIDSILRQAGYTTALFTSPHLVKINERFRINFKECSDEELILAWCQVKSFMEKGEKQGLQPLTFFEILFLMGMILFSQKEIDYCILETGLGGRLDATVLSDPVLSIITSISYDHMEILGDTIEKIAAEKAGIIKNGIPVVADGVIATVAALIAVKLQPEINDYIIVSHQGKEPAMKALLDSLGKKAVIHAELALGEGTGAVMMFPLLDMALQVYRGNTTFDDIQIAAYEDYGKC